VRLGCDAVMSTPVTLYTRVGCHLCDVVKDTLDDVRRERSFELAIVDVDADPELVARYGMEVPVVAINGRKAFKFRVSAAELRERLDREER
jgi:glutaredoxin